MKAYFYKISEFNNKSLTMGEVVDKGIITDSESTIYPQQNTGISELPSECEAHHFKCHGYIIHGYYFDIDEETIKSHKI